MGSGRDERPLLKSHPSVVTHQPLPDSAFSEDSIFAYEYENKVEPRRSLTLRFLSSILSFFRPALFTYGPRKELGPTSYLDGVRGFAAFMVYWQHHQLWARVGDSDTASWIFANGFGFEGHYEFVRLPFIRTFFSGGHFAVSVFYVLSGHVLSAKPLSLIYAGNQEKLAENVSSALFRRWVRLYIPAIGTTFLYLTSWHLFDVWVAWPEQKPTYWEELQSWYTELSSFTFVFNQLEPTKYWFHYNFHLWSIPVEFRGSIVVYTTLMAFSRSTRNARLLCETGLLFYFTYIVPEGCFFSMFLAGLMVCELQLLAREDNLPKFLERLRPYEKRIFCVLFFVSIYLSGVPSFDTAAEVLRQQPGWYFLSYLNPSSVADSKWFFLFIASTLFVASIPRIPLVKAFFETRFIQYLGHISFSLYLIHGPVLWTLGDRIYTAAGWARPASTPHLQGWVDLLPLSQEGPYGLEWAFILPHLILLPFTLWVAELATKTFDKPSVKISRWLHGLTLPR